MKNLLCVIAVLCAVCFSRAAAAADMVLVVSPNQSARDLKAEYKAINHFMMQLKPNQRAVLMDGLDAQTIGTFTAPQNPKHQHPTTKLQLNKAYSTGYAGYMRRALQRQKSSGNSAHNIDIPRALREAVTRHKGDAPLHIIVMGSAMFDNGKDALFSMQGGIIPSDAYLLHTREDNPFGVKGQEKMLQDVTVSFAWPVNMNVFHDQHLYFLERFWTLFVEQQGGQIGAMTQGYGDVLRIPLPRVNPNKVRYQLDKEAKKELIQLRPQQRAVLQSHAAISAEQILNAPDQLLHDVEISLSWTCACDVDLYAQAYAEAKWLYFGHQRSEEGQHWKDVQSATSLAHAHETITFLVPISLSRLVLAAHFYRGEAPNGVEGSVRLRIGAQTYMRDFHIPAKHGNKQVSALAQLHKREVTTPQLIFIDPLSIIGGDA